MKKYKDYPKEYIGTSDIAALILVGCEECGLKLRELHFGIDESYQAYIVDADEVEIGDYYQKVDSFNSWLKIYDDDGLVREFRAEEITVYRAAEMGCIIHLKNTETIRLET